MTDEPAIHPCEENLTMTKRWATFLVYGVSIAWFLFDQWSKHAILTGFVAGEVRPVIDGWLALTQAHNTGAAWSIMAGNPKILGYVSAVVCTAILVYERRFFPRTLIQSLALGLLLGGAAGNMLDRLRLNYVVDMIYVQWHGQYFFPIFNVADIGINVGVGLLALTAFLTRDGEGSPEPVQG